MTTSKQALLLLAVGLVPPLVLASTKAQAGEEPPVQGEGLTLAYLTDLHTKVHKAWADNFLAMASARLPKDHPVNLATRAVVVELVLAPGGRLLSSAVTTPSGSSEFDTSALDVVRDNAPYAIAPEEAFSDDGNIRVLWTFARDDRRCSDLRIENAQLPLPQAVRALVAQGRDRTAIQRLQAAADDAREQGFSSFAWAWLDSAQADQGLAVATARAAGGDGAGADKLRQAVAQGEQVETAARALARLAIPLCALVKEKLEGPAGEGRGPAVAVLRFGLERECLPGVLVVVKDRSAPEAQRVAAVEALGTLDDAEARAALQTMAKDGSPAIRAAALLAGTRAGAGRAAMFHLTGLLHDPAPQVRGAAAAALLRAGGEAMVPQLFQLFKEKDPRSGEAAAKELGTMKGEASAEMLGKLARGKYDHRVRLAAARALAGRRDQAVRKVQATLAGEGDAELRFLGSAALDAQKRLAAASAPDGHLWRASYAALAAGSGRLAAADWALVQFPKLDPAARVEIMGEWLAGTRTGEK
ncbi:MAG: TonB family protein [Polyangia bacterium]